MLGGLNEPPLVAIVGPTASGKTAVAIELARRIDGEIISADAVAVYRGLDIGSAKPSSEERSLARFHLIDVAEPDEEFTLADFESIANGAILDIRSRGKTPILCGGTGLYVRSVTATLSVPNVAPQAELRQAYWADVEENGAASLHARLAEIDPVSAAKIGGGDAKRIIRALEVFDVTGRTMSSFHTPEGIRGTPRANTFLFGLRWDRETLYRRIDERVDIMIENGFVGEVASLLSRGLTPETRSLQSLGYRHLCRHLVGGQPLQDAITDLKRDTRRFAKRQISWFKADPQVQWIEAASEPMVEAVADQVEQITSSTRDGR